MLYRIPSQSQISASCGPFISFMSVDFHLNYGVPPRSGLGSKLYRMFSKPNCEICRRHGLSYHSYADDTQVYMVIKLNATLRTIEARLKACLADISDKMKTNMLKLNQDKIEIFIFPPKNKSCVFKKNVKNCER